MYLFIHSPSRGAGRGWRFGKEGVQFDFIPFRRWNELPGDHIDRFRMTPDGQLAKVDTILQIIIIAKITVNTRHIVQCQTQDDP